MTTETATRPAGRAAAAITAASATAGVFLAAAALVFAKSMATPMNSDEHPFVACAALWSRHGLLPYRDFHYNHLPTLPMAFGLLFRLTDHLLLAARAFNGLCAAAVVATLFGVAARTFAPVGGRRRWLLAGAVGLIVLTNPVFVHASGIAWNHDFPTLMALWAFLALCRATRAGGSAGWAAAAGALIALAFTARLTFGPPAAALGLWLALAPGHSWGRRAGLSAAFLAGVVLAAAPTLWVVAQSPINAIWGNLLFPRLNTAYHAAAGGGRLSVAGKAGFVLLDLVRPGQGFLVGGAVVAAAAALRRRAARPRTARGRPGEGTALLIFAATVSLGCCVPTPLFRQYLYAPVPLFALALLVGWRSAADRPRAERWIFVIAAVSVAFGGYRYAGVARLATPSEWTGVRVHSEGRKIRAAAGPGRVLTFGPLLPLEGGSDIDPGLATGPYAYRVDAYLTEDDRRRLRLTGRDGLAAGFAADPPAGVLTGFTQTLDADLVRLCEASGYRPQRLRGGRMLWVRAPATRPDAPASPP